MSDKRSRTFTWEDPLIGAQAAPTMPGLDYLRAIERGELPPPPIMRLMDISFVSAEEGRVVFAVVPAEFHYNPIGMIHGGLACTICDSAMGCAIHTMLPAGAGYTTLELKVNYTRPLTVDTGQVFCEGKVIHVGSRVATAEARITDRAGKLYSHATTTCMIFRG
ncbi:MAG TPA: PaaI family thioesterase [Roseiflexaceae bacterium]|nr:PaaI family thioesterase [Roseiflexaceae bacterium]